jgi:type II secretory pathway pseudopilin PulG
VDVSTFALLQNHAVGRKHMKETLKDRLPIIMASRRRVIVICTLIAMIAVVLVAGVILLSRAKARALQIQAFGRLSQMRFALQIYESEHGTLPPLYLRDKLGNPIFSWRALILPYLGSPFPSGISTQLNLSQPWSSDYNRRLTDSVPPGAWVWFALNREPLTSPVSTHILAYLGPESIWEARTGLPKGRITEHPDAILLIWIPRGNLHPLQPGDITEQEVRERVEKREEVLFIAAGDGHRYGIVTIERGELAFLTRQQVLDRQKGRH